MAIPALSRLRRSCPDQKIILIVRPELAELANFINGIDGVIPFFKNVQTLQALRQLRFESTICFFEKRLFKFLRAAGAREIWGLRDHETPPYVRGPSFSDVASLPIAEMLDSLVLAFLDHEPGWLERSVGTHHSAKDPFWNLSASSMPAFELKSRRYAVIHLSGRGQFRRLDLNIAKDLKEECIAAGLTPVFTGIEDTIPPELESNAINLVGKTSLTDLLPLLSGADLIFGPDTGVTHLAASLGVKTVVMMGSSQPRLAHSELFFANRVFQYSGELGCRSVKKLHGYSAAKNAHCKGFTCSNSEQGFCVNDSNQNAYIRLAKEQIRKTHAWRPL